uniref:Uncharacterized protein n=1 Tax=Setaria viridis TaxID=4556 RepID=A0A4U6V139_SETVI|nr:hypothetical protein SEVIR_4G201200v2 [Setaria viridis]
MERVCGGAESESRGAQRGSRASREGGIGGVGPPFIGSGWSGERDEVAALADGTRGRQGAAATINGGGAIGGQRRESGAAGEGETSDASKRRAERACEAITALSGRVIGKAGWGDGGRAAVGGGGGVDGGARAQGRACPRAERGGAGRQGDRAVTGRGAREVSPGHDQRPGGDAAPVSGVHVAGGERSVGRECFGALWPRDPRDPIGGRFGSL